MTLSTAGTLAVLLIQTKVAFDLTVVNGHDAQNNDRAI